MPRGMPPKGEKAQTNAERQAAHRARRAAGIAPTRVVVRRPTDQRSRATRWRDAVSELLALQEDYQDWLDALPDNGREATREALEAITSLDLSELDIEPPRRFRHD